MTVDTTLKRKPEKYSNLDGLRAYLALLMVFIHVFTNSEYDSMALPGNKIAAYLSNFVLLFLSISGFAMCCGYYEKFKNKTISPEEFYSKRYRRTLPYFAFLVILDFIISPSVNSLYEAFADLTLCFGLLPNAQISVIGVGWTLGIIFLFYLLFPFFVYMLSNKARAWFSFVIVGVFHILCVVYFFDVNHVPENFASERNFVFCAVFFMVGGIIYLYRENIKKTVQKVSWLWVFLIVITMVLFFISEANVCVLVVLFALILGYAIGNKDVVFLCNPVTVFLSKYSLEIYLSHMIIFRVIQKTGLMNYLPYEWLAYIVTVMVTFAGAVVFSLVTSKGVNRFMSFSEKTVKKLKEKSNKRIKNHLK